MKINKELLSEMDACNGGMRLFLKNFKGDAELKEVVKYLLKDGRNSDLSWLSSNLLMRENIDIKTYVESNVQAIIENTTFDDLNIGHTAKIGSSGDDAQIGSSGNYAEIGSSGNYAQIGSSGNYAKIGSSGYDAKIQAKGVNAVIAITGSGRVKAGENGVIAIRWFDEKTNRNRIAVGYIGEDLKADTWYEVNSQGKFVEVNK